MNDPPHASTPTGLKLHRKSRLLEITFADGSCFMYPCEYLRVFSSETAGRLPETPVHGKEMVGISRIEPQGAATLQLVFDDGHAGSFSWDTLYNLGLNYERYWQEYLQQLADHDLKREEGRTTGAGGRVVIRLLYFIRLAKLAGRDEEEVELPESVTTVATLLAWLRNRREGWNEAFADNRVQVTVNRHFAESYTLIEHGDEVAIVPRAQ